MASSYNKLPCSKCIHVLLTYVVNDLICHHILTYISDSTLICSYCHVFLFETNCYYSWQRYFISGFQLFALVVQATNTGARSHGYDARAEPHKTGITCTAALRSSPEGMRDCMDAFKFDFQNYLQVNTAALLRHCQTGDQGLQVWPSQ